jgi:hypothetical protein
MKIGSNELTQEEYTTFRSGLIELRAHHMGTRENLKTLASQGQSVPVELIQFHDRMTRVASIFFPGDDTTSDDQSLESFNAEMEAEEQGNTPPPPAK